MDGNAVASTSSSRLGTCQQCQAAPARYRCPGCDSTTCSLACSTAHKAATACTGVAPPIWSRPMRANELSWGSLMRDQSYIAGVGRAVEGVGKQLVSDKVLPQGRMTARPGDAQGVRLDERSDKEERLVREARNAGVELVLLPKGMTKRLKNGSRWDPKHNRLEWTVEIAFQPRLAADSSTAQLPAATKVTTVPQPATNSIYAVLNAALGSRDKKGKGKAVEPEQEEWAKMERAWIESFRPARSGKKGQDAGVPDRGDDAPAETETTPSADAPDAEPTAPPEPASFELMLAFFSRSQHAPPPPPLSSSSDEDDSSDSDESGSASEVDDGDDEDGDLDVAPLPADDVTPTEPARLPKPIAPVVILPTARRLYRIPVSAAYTLQDALSGSSILETPLFEVWPRATLEQQVALGKVEVLDKPTAEQAEASRRAAEEARFAASRGRGRGRGGMRGRGGFGGDSGRGGGGYSMGGTARGGTRGRGGRSDFSGSSRGGRGGDDGESAQFYDASQRQQDSGWGKRAGATDEGSTLADKRPRNM